MKLRNKTKSKTQNLYNNIKFAGSFRSAQAFIKNQGLQGESKNVKKLLFDLDSYSLHREAKEKFKRRRVQINFANYQHLSDLMDVSKYASK